MIEIDFSSYTELLFKSKSTPEIAKLLKLLGEEFEISEHADHYYQVYKSLGIELIFSKEHYFQRFVVHNGFQDKIVATLPYKLDLSLSMKDVENLLGVPEHSSEGGGNLNYWAHYPELGVGVDYKTKTEKDIESGIAHIIFNSPQNDETRVAFHNRSQMAIFFQVRSTTYSPDIIGEVLKLTPSRIDKDDSNLFEILITRNPYFSPKSQLRTLEEFLKDNQSTLRSSTHDMELTVKFGIYSLMTNSFNLQLPKELITTISNLGISTDFDFRT